MSGNFAETAAIQEGACLEGLVRLDNQGVAWCSSLLHAIHDNHKPISGRLWANVETRVLSF